MKTILYARVSTVDQNLQIQRTQAEAAGFRIDEVVADYGVSGVGTLLREREQGRRLFDMLRAQDVLIVRWLDRLGRNYVDVTDTVREFIRRGVVVKTVINGLTFDGSTKDPMAQAVRDSMIAFMAASAEAQAEVTKEAQRVGIAHARAKDATKYKGRKPTFDCDLFFRVLEMLDRGDGVNAVARWSGLKRQTVYRIKKDPARQIAALEAWYPKQLMRQKSV